MRISSVVENAFTNTQLPLRLSYRKKLNSSSPVQKTPHTLTGLQSTASLAGWDDKCLLKRAQGDLSHASGCQKQAAPVLLSHNSFTLTVKTPYRTEYTWCQSYCYLQFPVSLYYSAEHLRRPIQHLEIVLRSV